jgi:phenylacetic acid degradation protein paaN
MRRIPSEVVWEKPQGKQPPLRVQNTFRFLPRGIGLVIACSTFPTWNSYSGLFADLVSGCPVIVKPHPGAILPLALTVETARAALAEAGFDPNVVLLAADDAERPIAQDLARHPAIQLIDYTGGPGFGEWIKANAAGKQVFTEQAGVNSVVIDSTAEFAGLCRNLAFSLCLYSGQMCTAPQNIYVPKDGIATDQGHKSFDEVVQALSTAVQKLLGDPERAAAVLGAIQNDATLERAASAGERGEVVLASQRVEIAGFPDARAASPAIVKATAGSGPQDEECFGPVSFVVPTADTAESLRVATDLARRKGAITALVHSTDETVLEQAATLFADAGVSLAVNLTGGLFVNQNAAFSDFHVSGANPAGTATLVDEAFVTPRFRVVAVRRELPAA